MACSTEISKLEGCLRDLTNERGIRTNENFTDFDNLRHGKISEDRFFRILDKNYGFTANMNQRKAITDKYSDGKHVSWREFVKCIDPKIDDSNVAIFPEAQISKMNSDESQCASSETIAEFETFRPIISRIYQYIKYQGCDLRECYRDFDLLNSGKINENQFFRNLPGPPDLSDAEICALAKRYAVPNRPGMVDYKRLSNDIKGLELAEKRATEGYSPQSNVPDAQLPEKKDLITPSVQQILERLRFSIYGRGIRVKEFFVDFDPLRHDQVTVNQFQLALDRALPKLAQLSIEDIQALTNYFRSKKNPEMISYKELCRIVDFPFHEMDLEKRPLVQPLMPYPGALSRPLQILNDDDEMRVTETINHLRGRVSKERIPTYQYFRDFDAGTGLTKVVTSQQLARLLSFLRLDISSEDCHRLARKFADPVTKQVNYAALCEAIDPLYVAADTVKQIFETPPLPAPIPSTGEVPSTPDRASWNALSTPHAVSSGDSVVTEVLMSRIRHLVLVNRIQLKKYFEDFDNLRTGQVSRSQFGRALSIAGLTRLELHDLTPAHVDTLIRAYTSPSDQSRVDWRRFVRDIDSVFTIPEIEKKPLLRVPPSDIFLVPKPGTGDWGCATDEMKDRCQRGMQHVRRNVMEHRIDLKPEFKAFDKVNRGHVKLFNFKQLMSMLNFHIPDDQMDAMMAMYADDEGFCYWKFLNDIEPPSDSSLHYEYSRRISRLRELFNNDKKPHEIEPVIRDVEGVMNVVKREVYQRRLRLSEWFRDYDPLKHGIVSRQRFRRVIALLPIMLKETELNLIEQHFKSDDDNQIRWRDFCDEIEMIFAVPFLDKNPLKEPERYQYEPLVKLNCLSVDAAADADRAMKKISNRVRQQRTQLTQWFNDFDLTHRMTLSRSQFKRVLCNLGLAEDITAHEWDALNARYRHPVGSIDNINYLAFSDDIFKLSGMEFRTP